MKTISRYIMTLALLLTAVTGAWAGEEPQLLTKIYASSSFLTGSQTFDDIATVTFGGTGTIAFNNGWIQEEYEKEATVTVTAVDGYTITSIKLYDVDSYNATISTSPFTAYLNNWGVTYVTTGSGGAGDYVGDQVAMIEVYGYKSEPAIDVKWDAATKTGTFTMPAFDVELTPIYAPAAQWAVVETVEQLPAATEGIIAGTNDSIVTPGIVVHGQGQVMYAVTSTNQATAPELSAFSATLPTAKDIADEGAEVLVWYYIKGADTPEGQEATAENTFNDSEICAEPIKVTVLTNKFDITFNAANANTIESGKATVTVGGTAATVTEGKLESVKMGSEVKMTAKEGYKFRKVEVKKKAASKLASEVTPDDIFKVIASDGMIYDNIAAAQSAGTTAQGLIVYVGSNTGHATYTHGMALALQDEGDNTWSGAKDACNAKNTSTPIVGALWIQASKDQWNTMFNAVGNDSKLRDCFSSAGGTNLVKFGNYWSSSSFEDSGQQGDFYMFSEDDLPGDWGSTSVYYNDNYHVRACIVF